MPDPKRRRASRSSGPWASLLLALCFSAPIWPQASVPLAELGVRLPEVAEATPLDWSRIDAVLVAEASGRVRVGRPRATTEAVAWQEVRDLGALVDFLSAVADARTDAAELRSNAGILLAVDAAGHWDAVTRLLAACAARRLWRIHLAVAGSTGLAAVPAFLPVDAQAEAARTSVRLSLRPVDGGRIRIAIGRKQLASPAELTSVLETLQALFPGLRLIVNAHGDLPWQDLVQAVSIARATGFPEVEFGTSFVDPDDHPLVNTGVVVSPPDLGAPATVASASADSNRTSPPVVPQVADPSQEQPGSGSTVAAAALPALDPAAASAVRAALAWLVRHQSADGSWSAHGFDGKCQGGASCPGKGYKSYDVGVTALALDALATAGMLSPDAADSVPAAAAEQALERLLAWQSSDGQFGSAEVVKPLYNHAIATLAVCQALLATNRDALRAPAQRAVDFLLAARSPRKAWRYKPRTEEHDTSVTGWCASALAAARTAGLRVDPGVWRELDEYFEDVTDARYARVGYTGREDAGLKITVPGKNDEFINHDTMAAIAILCQTITGRSDHDALAILQGDLLVQDLPRWDKEHHTNDYYYWYFGTVALHALEGPVARRPRLDKWGTAVRAALVATQAPADAGCAAGSWDADDRWSFEGGRVYGVAINALTLQSARRVPVLLGRSK